MKVLETRDVCKYFGGLKAVERVSIFIEEKEILGLFGPNGAGKTTLFNTITGFYLPTSGQVIFMGRPIHGLQPQEIAQMGIARTFQIVRPFNNLTVLNNVLLAYGHRHLRSWSSAITPFGTEENISAVRKVLSHTGLDELRNELAKNLPLGYRRRLELARALALQPKLLLLDEPLAGLSYEEANKLIDLVLKIRERGMAIILVEHNIQLAMNVCDRAVVLDYGVKIAEGSPQEVRSNERVIEAYLGREAYSA